MGCVRRVGVSACFSGVGEFRDAGDIFAYDVELDVDAGAHAYVAEVCVVEGVGDDGDAEAVGL